MIETEVKFLEREEFVKNEHGVYIYESKDGRMSINLPFILLEYKNYLIEERIVKAGQ